MPLISQTIDHLLGGITQRPRTHSAAEQLIAGTNVLADARYGLMKRPALDYQNKFTATITNWSSAFIHPIERDSNERQRLVILPHASAAALKVYDVVTGTELSVRDRTGGFAYLDGPTAGSDFRARTVGDTTFIVNRTAIPAMDLTAGKTPQIKYEAVVEVTRGEYSTPYTIYLDSRPHLFLTPSAATAVSEGEITTTEIARQLENAIKANFLTNASFTVTRFKSSLHIIRTFPTGGRIDFDVKVNDGLAGEGLNLAKGEIQSVEDLPRYAKKDMILKIVNSPETDKDDFYVKYRVDNTPEDGGVWVETAAPGRLTRLDRSTMPHQLVRKGNWVRDTVAEQFTGFEPLITQSGDDTDDDLGWDEDEGGGGISDDDVIIRLDDGGAGQDIGGSDVEQEITVAYDIDTSLMDPGADVDVVLYKYDGSQTEIARRSYSPGRTVLQDTQIVTTDTFGAGDELRIILEYQQDTPPTTLANQATLTLQKSTSPVVEDPLLDTTQPKRMAPRWLPPIRVTEIRAIQIEYRATDVHGDTITYPTGLVCQIQIGGSDTFSHTNLAGEGATEIATAMATLINANGTYTATNPSARIIKVVLTAGVTYARILSDTQMSGIIFYNSDLSLVTNELASKELYNKSDGSNGTVQSNTANTITVDSMANGTDNDVKAGDIFYVDEAGTYFVFDEVEYVHCEAGDLVTNPPPSFIGESDAAGTATIKGHPINDVFFHENRLGFVAGENILLSESGELFNFWRTATSQLLDSDRVDVQSASDTIGVIHSMVQWNGKLFGWAENVQFEISGAPAIGPRTIRIDTVSRYTNTSKFRPIVAGQRLFFMHGKGNFVQVQEYSPPNEDALDANTARDLTLEIPSLIAGNIIDAVADASLGLLAVLADGDQERIYVYSWALNPRGGEVELIHEAWQRWDVPAGSDVLGMEFTRGSLGVVLKRADGIFFADMDLDIDVAPGAAERTDYIDLLVTQATTSPTYTDKTTWTLPYSVNVDQTTEGKVVVWRTDTFAEVTVARGAATTVETVADEDLSAVNVNIGIEYTMTATLTLLFKRNAEGRPERTGRLQLRAIEVNYHDTTDFNIVTTLPGTTRGHTTSLSAATPRDGVLRHAAMGRAEDMTISLTQTSAGGARFSSVDWEAFEHARHRRV